jgi:hypothetical protein
MAVHYIHVQHRRATPFHRANTVTQTGKVRCKDGRRDFNRVFHGFSADIVPDSRFGLNRVARIKKYQAMSQSYSATVSSMTESLFTLVPGSGVCSVTAPFGHCGEETEFAFASFSPPAERM